MLPIRRVHKQGPQPLIRCIGCGSEVRSGFCYTGSVIAGLVFVTKLEDKETPIEILRDTPTSCIMRGGLVISVPKRIAFYKRNKGSLCDQCAANYHTLTDKQGVKHPMVMVDPRPGFIGITLSNPLIKPDPSPATRDDKRYYIHQHRLAGPRV